MKPSIKNVPADQRIEAFFQDIVACASKRKLRDEEVVAVTGRMMGYQIAMLELGLGQAGAVPLMPDFAVEVFKSNLEAARSDYLMGRIATRRDD